MKNTLLALFTTTLLVIGSCQKEPLPMPNPNYIVTADEQPTSLVTELETNLNNAEATDLNLGDVTITDYPAFIDYDPFTVVVTRTNSADSCLKGLEVTKAEKEQLVTVFKNKIECQRYNKIVIAKVHREIETWANTEKKILYAKYVKTKDSLYADFKMKAAYVNDASSKGLITLEQKQKSLNELELKRNNDLAAVEASYTKQLNLLNSKVKEKMKLSTEKLTATGKIKDCEKIYLESVWTILGTERYKKWISCYKYHYKNKK